MVLAERGYRAISYDQRGHGQSDWAPSGDYSIDAFVDDLKTVTATLEVPPILIGASLGGIVSLIAGGEAPTIPVQAMVLVDIATSTASGGVDRIFNFMNGHPNGFGTVEEAVDAVSTYLPGRERPRDPARLIKNLRSQGDRLYWHWDPEFVATAVRRHDAHMARASHAAGQIACPLLLIHGAQSDVTTESEIADLLARIPHARSTTIQDAHHMVVGDQSTVFSMAVSDFLDKQLSLERFEAARAFPRELIPKLAGRDS
jgi:non-heme chloroperoxidase